MKVRSDFVTNSSSSSFISFELNSKTLSDILSRFCDELNKTGTSNFYGKVDISGDSVSLYLDEGYYDDSVSSMLDVLNAFISTLFGYDEGCVEISKNEEKNKIIDLSNFEKDESPINKKVIAEIFKYRNEILEDMYRAQISLGDIGWGGDDDSRYDRDNYPKKRLKEITEAIAEERDCSIDEITYDDFWDYVGDKMSTEEITYIFLKHEDGIKKKKKRDYYVE